MEQGPKFDPEQSWKPLEERLERETDPRCRQLLEQVRDHMRAEIHGELEPLMDTLIDQPRYHLWGFPIEAGPKGRDAVRAFYRSMIEGGGHRFHFDIQRIVVDHRAVVTEGEMHQRMTGASVVAGGVEQVEDEDVDPEATYLSTTQISTVWPAAEDGRLIGEDIYLGSPFLARLRRL